MKGSTLKELLKLNQSIMIQQQLKIAALLGLVEDVIKYGKKNNDLKLADIIDKGLKKFSAFDESTKLVTAQSKGLKARIEEEDKNEKIITPIN